MIVGVMTVQLCLNGIGSLKEKRSIVKSVTSRLKNRFNVSIAEVDHHDSKRTALVGLSIVANDSGYIDRQFEKILAFMRNDGRFFLGTIERETFGA